MSSSAATYDVHAHIVPPALLAELDGGPRFGVERTSDRDGRTRLVLDGRVTTGPVLPGLTDVAQRLARMDEQGVDVQLLSPFVDTTAYALPHEHAAPYSRWVNEHIAAVVAEQPTRFLGLATVPLQDPAAAVATLRHAVDDLGMVGCEIASTVDGTELDQADLEPFWATAAELGALVLLHPHASLAGRGVTRHFLWNLVGNPAESTVALAHLILSGTLERHPQLTLCAVHGGGFLPYQLGRLDRGYRAMPDPVGAHLTRSPGEWARHLLYDTITHEPRTLRLLLDLVGHTQVVLGTDHPFAMGDPDPLGTLDAIPGLTPEERDAVTHGNLARVLAGLGR